METQQEQMLEVIKYQLEAFNDEEIVIDDETVLNNVLSETDGEGTSNSKNIFESAIRWTIKRNKLTGKVWPPQWLALTAKQLATTIVSLLLFFCSFSQMTLNLSAAKTELRKSALTIGVAYSKSVEKALEQKTFFWAGKNTSLLMTPDINIETGTADAFSSITAKFTGLGMIFKTTTIAGLETPDLHRGFHTFPMSIGIETNNNFNFLNSLLEVGWVPWIQTVKEIKMGVFIQAGLKSKIGSSNDSIVGGKIDQSYETVGDGIFRIRGLFRINTPTLIAINFFKLGVIGSANGWWDLAHKAGYYRVDAIVRLYLNDVQFMDFIYQKGSGAPLFNNGDQIAVGLTMVF